MAFDLRKVHPSRPNSVAPTLESMRRLVRHEAQSVLNAAEQLSAAALEAAEETAACQGAVIVTGVGKAGLVGQKLVATLASTGTPAHFLHPSEAVHGDLGRVQKGDIIWAISNSGRSDEVVRIAESLKNFAGKLISLTASTDNPLADIADINVTVGRHKEIDEGGLAPTSSTAVIMAVGDSIAITASQLRGFQTQDFAKFHPGGSLGRQMQSAGDVMRLPQQCRVSFRDATVRQAVTTAPTAGRCTGAVMVVDEQQTLLGIFTDSDLARMLAGGDVDALAQPIASHMTSPCRRITVDATFGEVTAMLQKHHISELPVVDSDGRVVGMIDRTDLQLECQAGVSRTGDSMKQQSAFRIVGLPGDDDDAMPSGLFGKIA